jgi:hypothetical protein
MAWRIVQTTDGQHIGEELSFVEAGNVITFNDGDVVAIERVFTSEDGREVVTFGENYQMTLIKE